MYLLFKILLKGFKFVRLLIFSYLCIMKIKNTPNKKKEEDKDKQKYVTYRVQGNPFDTYNSNSTKKIGGYDIKPGQRNK